MVVLKISGIYTDKGEVEMSKNFVDRQYPLGKEIEVPHVALPKVEKAIVVNHTVGMNSQQTTGIIVRMEDGSFQEIESRYLSEDGSGVY
jgi:hypothetical protein